MLFQQRKLTVLKETREYANETAVEAWEQQKRQKEKRQQKQSRKRRRDLRSSDSDSPRKSTIRPSRRPIVHSSPSEDTSKAGRPRSCLPLLSARKQLKHVEIILPTTSQQGRYNLDRLEFTQELRQSSPQTEFEIPDSQPSSPSAEAVATFREADLICEPQEGLEFLASEVTAGPRKLQDEPKHLALSIPAEPLQGSEKLQSLPPSTPFLEGVNRLDSSDPAPSSPLRTPVANSSTPFATQIPISDSCFLFPSVEGDLIFDIEQDEQGQRYIPGAYPDSVGALESISQSEGSQKLSTLASLHSKPHILSSRDPNSQTSCPSQLIGATEEKATQYSRSSENFSCSYHPAELDSPAAAQENIVEISRESVDSESNQNMSAFRPTIDAILSDAPPRSMASAPVGLRDQVRIARAMSAANTTALRANFEAGQMRHDSRSPSVIPEPIQYRPPGDSRLEPQIVDIPQPRHPSQLSPHAPLKPSKLSSPPQMAQVNSSITQLEPPLLGYACYPVPLPFSGRVRDQYYATIRDYSRETSILTSAKYPDEATIRSVEKMMSRLHKLTNHVDLDDDTALDNAVSLDDESQWAVTNAAKFRFLRCLLQELRDSDLHITVVAQMGKLLDMLRRFVMSTKLASLVKISEIADYEYRPPGDFVVPLKVTLLSSTLVEPKNVLQPAHLIVAFDSTFNPSTPMIASIRKYTAVPGQLCPIIYPMVYSSVEHIERCIPPMQKPIDRLIFLTHSVLQTRLSVGELQPEEFEPEAAAQEVASFIKLGGVESAWTLFGIRNIQLPGIDLLATPQGSAIPPNPEQAEAATRKRYIVRSGHPKVWAI